MALARLLRNVFEKFSQTTLGWRMIHLIYQSVTITGKRMNCSAIANICFRIVKLLPQKSNSERASTRGKTFSSKLLAVR